MEYVLIINHKKDSQFIVEPIEGVKLYRGIDCTPARLDFAVVDDGTLTCEEGDTVQFKIDNSIAFQGYVFEIERKSGDTRKYICYDQLRYFKNKDCIVYYEKTASELIKSLCEDYSLIIDADNFADTKERIIRRIEDNKTLADIIMYALDYTLINSKTHDMYYLYDDGGKICLTYHNDMVLDIYIDKDCLEDYTYTSSIDKDTYNAVKVVRQAQGMQGGALVQTAYLIDNNTAKQWGVLQYLLKVDDKDGDVASKAKRIMELKNRVTRYIPLKNVIGDIRVRGGSILFVDLDFGDFILKEYIMVEAVEHYFNNNQHTMDLTLKYIEKGRGSKHEA